MNDTNPGDRQNAKRPALVFGAVATCITAGAVSWATPDGNLVVTLVPGLAVGLVVFGVAWWGLRRAQQKARPGGK